MSRIAYVNGQYLPHNSASVHIEDRGYQFADGVYEVIAVQNGRLIDGDWHMERLQRSLSELRIAMPMSPAALNVVLRETVRRNRFSTGIVYLQVSRGVARRDHPFPKDGTPPALVVTARRTPPPPAKLTAPLDASVAVLASHAMACTACTRPGASAPPSGL